MALITLAAVAAAFALPGLAAATKTPAGVISVPLSRDEGLTEYYAKLQVGTPLQTEYLKIDTGSPRYSFLDPRNEICKKQGNNCKTLGTFNNKTSKTSHYAGTGFADALGYVGQGDYLTDTVVIGGVSTKNMYFGYTSFYSFPDKLSGDIRTILGLSLECGVAGPKCTDRFSAYMLPELKNASKINYLASSIYLGPDDKKAANARMLLGGAYDKAKIDGDLITVPMVDPFSVDLTGGQTNSVNVTSVEVFLTKGNNHTKETYGKKNVGVPVLLDTGVASWYLTDKTMPPILRAFGAKEQPFGQQYFVVDCKYADSKRNDGYIAVEFGVHGTIKVPLHGVVSKFPDGTCGVFAASRGYPVSIFGDPFLRNVYSIFDQEKFSISMGKVKHTAEENIVPFPKGGFKPTHY
ncbi:related to aspartic proteinase OPSB [Fusarium fujikuroi]|nr:related to aspartic proteinase OPSB [Fusarium fujikuroi]SCO04012.1 related to aspartic proteinase OPSB [Fusarium fujikuroi]SCO06897.1 related to aspartic proteinase OPSB [Fusarium fujikuroi]SCO07757.1 related to aspartic proteinase OPSB [Fusarium fujikuroi]SCO44820.1 related to aspartic proteinase OPSB [Fusarium fujikuroi]